MTIYILDIILSTFEEVACHMSSSNCGFLTCIQVSHKAGKVDWYCHLFKNFPLFVVIYTVKGFIIVNEAEVDVFLEFSWFFYDTLDVGNLIHSVANNESCSWLLYFSKPTSTCCVTLLALLSKYIPMWVHPFTNLLSCTICGSSSYSHNLVSLPQLIFSHIIISHNSQNYTFLKCCIQNEI